jgi:hypothetical protein
MKEHRRERISAVFFCARGNLRRGNEEEPLISTDGREMNEVEGVCWVEGVCSSQPVREQAGAWSSERCRKLSYGCLVYEA